jgi:hypothetical protein
MARQVRIRSRIKRLLGDYRSADARLAKEHRRALEAHFGPLSPLAADYAEIVSVLRTRLAWSFQATTGARTQRERGRGRRPGLVAVERCLRREGLQFGSYDQALRRLEELCARNSRRQPSSGAELLARVRAGGGA